MKKITLTLIFCLLVLLVSAQNPAIHIEESGKGKVVLLLPGFTTPGSVWDATIANFQQSYKTVKVSYAGFNGLPSIEMPWYETIKQALVSYIQENNYKDVTIIGHSMGGMLALDIAAALPEEVNSLIIVDALACMRAVMMPGVPAEAFQYDSPYNQQMLNQTDSARKAMAVMMSSNMTLNQVKVEQLVQWNLATDMETFVYGYTDLLKLDLRPTLSEIQAKTLILAAPFPTIELVEQNLTSQYVNLNSKEIIVAPNSRHFIMFDQAEWFYQQVNSFLNK
jgi:pimeloyl-ACP methyl ester carboxylesterase